MKKYLILLLVVAFSSASIFATRQTCTTFYLVYNGGDQKNLANYSITTTPPGAKSGSTVLDHIEVCVPAGTTITQVVFNCVFELLDITNTAANTLDDEPEKTVTGTCTYTIKAKLEKKSL